MGKSKIEWTDVTWNPVTGCTPVSAGCDNCYAKRNATRFRGRAGYPADDPFRVVMRPDRLEQPLKWKEPRRVFVCSMGDLFHDDVTDEFIIAVFKVMKACPQHTFMLLSKRENRALAWFEWIDEDPIPGWPLPNVWFGFTVENRRQADIRVPVLLQIPAAVRFVSCEPLLEAVNLRVIDYPSKRGLLDGLTGHTEYPEQQPIAELPEIDWVIAGGESGHRARPCRDRWIRMLQQQCNATSTPFFFKQWGEWLPISQRWHSSIPAELGARPVHHWDIPGSSDRSFRVGKKIAGHLFDGQELREYPEAGRRESEPYCGWCDDDGSPCACNDGHGSQGDVA